MPQEFSLNVGDEYQPTDPVITDEDLFDPDTIEPGTLPELNDDTELVVALESIRQMQGLVGRLERQGGINRDFAMEALQVGESAGLKLPRVEYYTNHLSRTQYQTSLESIKDRISNMAKQAWEKFLKFWRSAIAKVRGFFSKKPDPKQAKAKADKKAMEFIKALKINPAVTVVDVAKGTTADGDQIGQDAIGRIDQYLKTKTPQSAFPGNINAANWFRKNGGYGPWLDRMKTNNQHADDMDTYLNDTFEALKAREDDRVVELLTKAVESLKASSELSREFDQVILDAAKTDNAPKTYQEYQELAQSDIINSDDSRVLYELWKDPAKTAIITTKDRGPEASGRDDVPEEIVKLYTEFTRVFLATAFVDRDRDLLPAPHDIHLGFPTSVITGEASEPANESLETKDYGEPREGDAVEDLRDPVEIEADGLIHALESLSSGMSRESFMDGFKARAANAWEMLKKFLQWVWKKITDGLKYLISIFKRLFGKVEDKVEELEAVKSEPNNLANPENVFVKQLAAPAAKRVDLSNSLTYDPVDDPKTPEAPQAIGTSKPVALTHAPEISKENIDAFNTLLATSFQRNQLDVTLNLGYSDLGKIFKDRFAATKTEAIKLTESMLDFLYKGSTDVKELEAIQATARAYAPPFDLKLVFFGSQQAFKRAGMDLKPVSNSEQMIGKLKELNGLNLKATVDALGRLETLVKRETKDWEIFLAKFNSASKKLKLNDEEQQLIGPVLKLVQNKVHGVSNFYIDLNRFLLETCRYVESTLDVIIKMNRLATVNDDGTMSTESYEDILGNFGDEELIQNYSLEDDELVVIHDPEVQVGHDDLKAEADDLIVALESLNDSVGSAGLSGKLKAGARKVWENFKNFMRWIWKKLTDGYKYVTSMVKRLLGRNKSVEAELVKVQNDPNNLANPNNTVEKTLAQTPATPEPVPASVSKPKYSNSRIEDSVPEDESSTVETTPGKEESYGEFEDVDWGGGKKSSSRKPTFHVKPPASLAGPKPFPGPQTPTLTQESIDRINKFLETNRYLQHSPFLGGDQTYIYTRSSRKSGENYASDAKDLGRYLLKLLSSGTVSESDKATITGDIKEFITDSGFYRKGAKGIVTGTQEVRTVETDLGLDRVSNFKEAVGVVESLNKRHTSESFKNVSDRVTKNREDWNAFVADFTKAADRIDLNEDTDPDLLDLVTEFQAEISKISVDYLNIDKHYLEIIKALEPRTRELIALNKLMTVNADGTLSTESLVAGIKNSDIAVSLRKLLDWIKDKLVKGYTAVRNQLKRALLYLTNLFNAKTRKELLVVPQFTPELMDMLNTNIFDNSDVVKKFSPSVEAYFNGKFNEWLDQIQSSMVKTADALAGPLALDGGVVEAIQNHTDIVRDRIDVAELTNDMQAAVDGIAEYTEPSRKPFLERFYHVKRLQDFFAKIQTDEIHEIFQRATTQIHALGVMHDGLLKNIMTFRQTVKDQPSIEPGVQLLLNAVTGLVSTLGGYYLFLGRLTEMLSNVLRFRNALYIDLANSEKMLIQREE